MMIAASSSSAVNRSPLTPTGTTNKRKPSRGLTSASSPLRCDTTAPAAVGIVNATYSPPVIPETTPTKRAHSRSDGDGDELEAACRRALVDRCNGAAGAVGVITAQIERAQHNADAAALTRWINALSKCAVLIGRGWNADALV